MNMAYFWGRLTQIHFHMTITTLELYTSNLEGQKQFYTNHLSLKLIEESDTSISFKIGHSILKFTSQKNVTPYHFAINIPSNQHLEALDWLKQRIDIIKDQGSEIQYFDFWDANAIYFYDKDLNIVELIARKTLNLESHETFNASSLLSISEIGIPTVNIESIVKTLTTKTELQIYSGSLERFCSLGNENGLFIIIDIQLKKEWYPTLDFPHPSDFRIEFSIDDKTYAFKYQTEKLEQIDF